LAISGMLLLSPGLRRNKKQAMLYYFIVAYWMATAAFYILSRFRAPLIPLLGIMAGAYLERCVYLSQKKKQRLLKFALPCLLVGFFICYASYDVYRFGYESAIMRIVRPNGVIVEVSPTETMALDNGPETFGGWSYVKFEPYKVLEKKFSGLGEGYKRARFELNVFWESPGMAELEINGQKEYIISDRQKFAIEKFNIPFPEDDTVKIRLLRSSAPVNLIMDGQRNYGRTFIDGKKQNAELVCRIYCYK
jgi:hypothetical protein